MSVKHNNEVVPPATDDEISEIWENRDTILLARRGTQSAIHLYQDCQAWKGRHDYQEKSPECYPPGWKDMCAHCLWRWRRSE